jgi:hypothetical protein
MHYTFHKRTFYLTCVDKTQDLDVHIMEKFLYQIVLNMLEKHMDYRVKITLNELITLNDDSKTHLIQHFEYLPFKINKHIVIPSWRNFYIELFCIYSHIGLPFDITRIIMKLCKELRTYDEYDEIVQYGEYLYYLTPHCNVYNCWCTRTLHKHTIDSISKFHYNKNIKRTFNKTTQCQHENCINCHTNLYQEILSKENKK